MACRRAFDGNLLPDNLVGVHPNSGGHDQRVDFLGRQVRVGGSEHDRLLGIGQLLRLLGDQLQGPSW